MKTFMVSILLLTATCLSAQTSHGVATFALPDGWLSTDQNGMLVLSPRAKTAGTCEIRISATENQAISSTDQYLKYRNQRAGEQYLFTHDARAVTRLEANGIISYTSGGRGSEQAANTRTFFYTFANGQSTFFIQLVTDNNICTEIFNNFLISVKMEAATEEQAGEPKSRHLKAAKRPRTRKATPAPIPAAPAPMM
jgi:hypothetical protein